MPRNKPAFIIFNKIDTSFFQPKSDLGQLNTPLKILTVGRLHWIKGFPHLLKALALFEGRGINWKLRIIGEGVEKEHLFYTAMGLGILDKVNFLGGKTQEDVKTEMMDSDIFINSSFFESNCRALLEAQAAGLLVVSNHWPEAEKIVIHEKTGWLIPKHDPGAIADQVEKIVALPLEKRKAVAKNAINHVQQNFNLKDATKDFEQLLKQ
jgi:colanic acid/amylovoran biosynthesis glycosyltransferase